MDISSLRERGNTSVFTVSELNSYIKTLFENDRVLTSVTLKGEISNFTNHSSGHLYFSLKDSEGQIRAVMFRSRAQTLKFRPESGMKVIVHGSVSVYGANGSYQIYVSSMQPDGIGALYLAYEQLKERLSLEGLFAEEHKKPIPRMPESVGVVTSPTGAAVRDIINVITRRFPLARIYLYPALVQGDGAEDSIIKGVDYFDHSHLCDVIIVGRGGGSIEDLWAFNGERLARRIYDCEVPIISAVGHEIDFTICDFVADLRAPTPSAAAELAVPDARELLQRIDYLLDHGSSMLLRTLERSRERLSRCLPSAVFSVIERNISERSLQALEGRRAAERAVKSYTERLRSSLSVNAEKLRVMDPLAVLARGYSITEHGGRMLSSVKKLAPGAEISVSLSDGVIKAEVKDIMENENG